MRHLLLALTAIGADPASYAGPGNARVVNSRIDG